MSRFLRRSLVLGMLLGMPLGAGASPPDLSQPLDVEQCVGIALEHSDRLAQAHGDLGAAGGTRLSAYRNLLPSVYASASWRRDYQDYFGLSGVEYSGSFSIGARQDLFNLPGIADFRAAGARHDAARADLETTQDQVALTTREQFYTCVAAVRLAEVEERAVAVAQEQLRRSETLFRLGSVARSDVLQARVNLAESQQVAIQRRNAVPVEHARLAMVIGLDPRTPLRVDSTLALPAEHPGGELDAWVTEALARRPELAAATARLHAAEIAEGGAKLQRLPRASASGGWARSARDPDEEFLGGDFARYSSSWSLALSLSLDLFNGLLTEGQIQSARGNRRSQEANRERMVKEIALEVRNAFLGIGEQRENLEAARTSVNLAEENLRLQQALYESGGGTLLEWDNARLDLRRARVFLIQAEINLLLAHARFAQSIGSI